jgi:hypothetical protein
MRVKRMVKRLFAVGTGVAMLGATAMGALAADLGDYPNQFVSDGTFDGFFVVGEAAAAVDNLAMTDIATGMKYLKPSESSSATVEGDNWMVATSAKKYEMANSNASDSSIGGETFRDIITFIGDDELGALSDGTWATNEADYSYEQFLFFDVDGANPERNRVVKYTENEGDVTADHLFFANSRQIARYKLEFTSTAQSDVTDSAGTADTTGTYLDDFENTDFGMLGSDYSVVLARRTSSGGDLNAKGIKLTLMAGSTRDTLLEGETKTYTVGDATYEVTLSFTDDDEAKFTVNGEATNKLKVGETYVLSDKSEIGVSEVLYQAYAGGVHSATFFVGAQKMVLQDDDVSDVTGAYNIKVGSEDIDGTTVIITGTDNNVTFTVSTIEVNMTAEDDFFVGSGDKLSEVISAAAEEEEVLMNDAFDVQYEGLTEEATHDLKLRSSSSRRYKVHLFDGDGNEVDIPVAYAEAQYNLSVGEESQAAGNSRTNNKRLHWQEAPSNGWLKNNSHIYKDDYFIVTGGSAADGSAKSYLLQYKGQDKTSKTSPKIKFKDTGSGSTLEYTASTTNATATIKLGGYSFIVHGQSSAADDAPIVVDLDGSGGFTGPGANVSFVDSYGSEWSFRYSGGAAVTAVAQDYVVVTGNSAVNGDDYDTVAPSTVSLNLTASASGPEMRGAITGVTLLTPDGETEVQYGYSTMGTFLEFTSPSSDPNEFTMTYPAKQRLPQVFFTSGATSSSSTSGGTLTSVEFVDATKLDSEIAAVDAQNLIAVGGPCVNTVAAELMGNPADCAAGFTPGKGIVKLWDHANGNVAMLVAGYSGADTRLLGKVLANTPSKVTGVGGDEVEVEGTTSSDAVVSVPVVMAAADDMAADDAATDDAAADDTTAE